MAKIEETELLLLGSLPLETAEEVFRWTADTGLAAYLSSVPDGEIGDRGYWITGLGYRLFNGHPDIETIARPDRSNGVENWKPQRGLADQWSFRLRTAIEQLRFGDPGWRLGYAREAISSYFVFKTLREKGVLPAEIKFQVSLPMTISTCSAMFRDALDDLPAVAHGFDQAMAAEMAKIFAKIPATDLVIQWDSTAEQHILGAAGEPSLLGRPIPAGVDASQLAIQSIVALSSRVPEDVTWGYHLCYGSLTGFFMQRPKDLSNAVLCMDRLLEHTRRRTDFIHFPVLDHVDEPYFSPLRDLAVEKARFFAGVIHNMDDPDDYQRRLDRIRRYIPRFGIGAPCGYGRFNPERLPGIAREHLEALELLHRG